MQLNFLKGEVPKSREGLKLLVDESSWQKRERGCVCQTSKLEHTSSGEGKGKQDKIILVIKWWTLAI